MTSIQTSPIGLKVATPVYRLDLDARILTLGLEPILPEPPKTRLYLHPIVNGSQIGGLAIRDIQAGQDEATITWRALRQQVTIRLVLAESFFAYWYELPARPEGIKSFRPGWASGSFFQVRNFDPDLDSFDIPHRIKMPLRISSARVELKQFFQLDQGNYMIPPYLLALYDRTQYVGLGLAQAPATMAPMDVSVSTQEAQINFEYPAPVRGAYRSVPVVVCLGFQDAQVLDRYRLACELLRGRFDPPAATPPTPVQRWWSDPIYTTWGDQVYRKHVERGHFAEEAGAEEFLSADLVDEALAKLASEGLQPKTIVLDEGWHQALGDWQAAHHRFKGSLKRFIAGRRRRGYRVMLHFNPFLAAEDSQLATQHADWLVKDAAGEVIRMKRCGRICVLPDWSNAHLRRRMIARVKAMVSPAGLDADGIKLAGHKYIPPADAQLASTTFGRGERYLLGVLRAVHAAVKAGKAEAPIALACLNPLLADCFDIVRLGNISEVNHELYVDRARTASWLLPGKPIDTDDWACWQKVVGVETFLKALAGAPNIYSAFFRGDGRWRFSGAAGGHPVQITPPQYRVLATAWRLYELSRDIERSYLRCDWQQMEFSVGLPPAPHVRTYQGGSVLAIYAARAIHLGSLQAGPVIIDAPWDVESVEEISRQNGRQKVEFHPCLDGKILFDVRSCRDEILTYQVNRK